MNNLKDFEAIRDQFINLVYYTEDLMQHTDCYDFQRDNFEKIVTEFGKLFHGKDFVYNLLND